MPEFLKAHAREYLMVFAVMLVVIQILLPTTLDVLFDVALVGCVYLGMQIGKKAT
jgi:hypothetical protein